MKKKICLVIETHSDDSCISCAGFINKFKDKYSFIFQLLTCSTIKLRHLNKVVSDDERLIEYLTYLKNINGYMINDPSNIESPLNGIPPFDLDSKMDTIPQSLIVSAIEKSLDAIKPDTLIIQGPSFHNDHNVTYKACIAALRPCGGFYPNHILVSENPTYVHHDHLGTSLQPNYYVSLTENIIDWKIKLFNECFPSQIRPSNNYLSSDGIKDWAKYRGIEARCEYAEAFYQFSKVV